MEKFKGKSSLYHFINEWWTPPCFTGSIYHQVICGELPQWIWAGCEFMIIKSNLDNLSNCRQSFISCQGAIAFFSSSGYSHIFCDFWGSKHRSGVYISSFSVFGFSSFSSSLGGSLCEWLRCQVSGWVLTRPGALLVLSCQSPSQS